MGLLQAGSGPLRYSSAVARAKIGEWEIILTPKLPVPREWFGDVRGKRILCLASGGGQQVPILAAAGANVVSFDLSDEQLAKDRMVAQREGAGGSVHARRHG